MWWRVVVLLLIVPSVAAEVTLLYGNGESVLQTNYQIIVNEDKNAFRPIFIVLEDNSTSFSPVNVSANVTFSATAVDPAGGDWYLLVCNGTAGTLGGYCVGNELCYSGNVTSGTEASCMYNTSGIMSWNQSWFGYACNNETLCSNLENSTAPFFVNHAPSAIVSLMPATPSINDQLTCNPLLSDPDPGDTPTATYRWWRQNEGSGLFSLIAGATLGTLSFPDHDSNDLILCEALPTDSFGLSGSAANSSSVVIANGTLVAGLTTSTPVEDIGVARPITASCQVVDGDAASVSITLQDNRTGSWQTSSTSSASVYVNESSRTLGAIVNTTTSYDITMQSTTSGTYGFRTVCVAADTNASPSTSGVLTLMVSPDTTAPVISGVSDFALSSSATFSWSTDDASDSQVDYGTTLALGSTVYGPSLETSHSIQATGLVYLTTYYYTVTSCNNDGYCDSAGPYNFTTLSSDEEAAPTTKGYCTGTYVERAPDSEDGKIKKGDVFEFYCELPARVHERQDFTVTVTNNEKQTQKTIETPDPLYGDQVVLYP